MPPERSALEHLTRDELTSIVDAFQIQVDSKAETP